MSPTGRVRTVLDADAYNEIDDQFAVAYALLSPERIRVEALNAAPFTRRPEHGHWGNLAATPAEGMELSHAELVKILELMEIDLPVYRGSGAYLPAPHEPVESEAARQLAALALAAPPDDPLYVVVTGCSTNVASAILLEPSIIERIVVVWLGGNGLHWPHTRVYNLNQDRHAARVLFDSGVPLVHVGCFGVASQLLTNLPQVRDCLDGRGGAITRYLYDLYRNPPYRHGVPRPAEDAKVLWDVAAVAYLMNPAWTPSRLVPSPRLSDYPRWVFDPTRHVIRDVYHVDRNAIIEDLFASLTAGD